MHMPDMPKLVLGGTTVLPWNRGRTAVLPWNRGTSFSRYLPWRTIGGSAQH